MIIIIIIIGTISSVCDNSESPKNNWPHKNTMIANGKVSRRGALDEISPSLLRPLLRLKNDPVLSPTKQANPRKVPSTNADKYSEPKSLLHFQWGDDTRVYRYCLVDIIEEKDIDPTTKCKKNEQGLTQQEIFKKICLEQH